jgi:hypothetical protein
LSGSSFSLGTLQLHLHLALRIIAESGRFHESMTAETLPGEGTWQKPRSAPGGCSGAPSGPSAAAAPAEAPPAPAAADSLGAAEQAALAQLDAADGYATRWPVSRSVARSLASRQLVVIAPDYVLLTEAGRRALTGDVAGGG